MAAAEAALRMNDGSESCAFRAGPSSATVWLLSAATAPSKLTITAPSPMRGPSMP